MLHPHQFGTHDEAEQDDSKKTLYQWAQHLFESGEKEHNCTAEFWRRAEQWTNGDDIDIGAMSGKEQHSLWMEWTNGIYSQD